LSTKDPEPLEVKSQETPSNNTVLNSGIPHPGQQAGFVPTTPSIPGGEYFPGNPLYGMELATGYFPIQRLGRGFDFAKALQTGTLFPEMYRPYQVKKR